MNYKQKKPVEGIRSDLDTRLTVHAKLSQGMHRMSIFGDEFANGSFCWMIDDELWLSMIIVKEEFRMKGILHHLLDAAKCVSGIVVIPEPLNIVPRVAAKHGYIPSKRWIEDYGENIDVMEWIDPANKLTIDTKAMIDTPPLPAYCNDNQEI